MTMYIVSPQSPIGIIAGSGNLSSLVIEEAINQRLFPSIVSFDNTTQYPDNPCLRTSLGKIGEILDFLKKNNVKFLIFAGKIQRPSLTSLGFDSTGIKWMQRLGIKAFAGDDSLLKGITELLQEEGFQIISPRDFLPSLVLPQGLYTEVSPNEVDEKDIERGKLILDAISNADIGQACVVQEGLALGVEAIEGTKSLIERCHHLKRKLNGGVLIKMAKKNQSTVVDLPTIGVETIESIKNCDLNGIAISANTTQVLNFKQVINLCNQHKLFLKVIEG